MQNTRLRIACQLVLLALLGTSVAVPLAAAEFVVVSGSNLGDSNPGDGLCRTPGTFGACSLRAAVEESNALPGSDTIVLGPGSHQVLSPERVLEDHVTIKGAGADQTTLHPIEGGNYQLFVVLPGIVAQIQDMTLQGFSVSATPDSSGAAISNQGSTLLIRMWFRDNYASQGCGAVRSTGLLEVINSTFSGNRAGFDHGAGALCVVDSGTGIVSNSTFVGNRSYRGGALEVVGGSSFLRVVTSTFVDNVSIVPIGVSSSSVAYVESGELELERNLLVGDCRSAGGTVTSEGGNLEGPGNTCFLTTGDQMNVPVSGLDLGPLGFHGGTIPTVLLGLNSTAIDPPVGGATCPLQDARSFPRDAVCDAGAFERQAMDVLLLFADGFESGDLVLGRCFPGKRPHPS